MTNLRSQLLIVLSILLVVACQAVEEQTAVPTTTAIATNSLVQSAATAATELNVAVEETAPPEQAETAATPALAEATPLPPTEAPPTATPTETPIPTNPIGSIRLQPVLEGVFNLPLYLTHAGDSRLFVVEQPGFIRIVQDGQLIAEPFLDIRDRIRSVELEQGLLGLAFDPDFAQTGVFYVNYTNVSGDTHISRFAVSVDDPNRADPESETVLLTIDQPYPNHNGGQLAFGPDGYLYIGVGDGGSANDPLGHGQNPDTLLGNILRLDVPPTGPTYNIPATNPSAAAENGRAEIWAWGLRNPWRFSFDRVTGDLFVADVGQNLWEELNYQPASSAGGENYGWNTLEGSHCFLDSACDAADTVLPIFEYSHQEGCSITGGYMYRGTQHLMLYGNYFVGDYCQGTIWRLFPSLNGEWSAERVYDSEHVISSFGEDASGELYVIDHTTGSLYKIVP